MTPRQLFLLSPYRPPTSYPVSLSTEEAAAWLNGYSALWHPLALRGALPPLPASAYDHNEPALGAIYALASGPSLFLPDDWRRRAADAGAIVFEATADRTTTVANLLAALPESPPVAPELVRLFAGLGYGHLMLDTLFDASSHDRLLDLEAFWVDVQAAVEAAMVADVPTAKTHLTAAGQKLMTAREGLAPSGIIMLDIIVRDAVAADSPWPCPFTSTRPVTVVATSQTLTALAPERLEELKAAVPDSVDLAVGVACERDDVLLPMESQLWSLRAARKEVQALLGTAPRLFARPHSQYHPQLPSWLNSAGFSGMVLLNLDGATLPSRYAPVMQWPGPDGKSVNAFARDPLPGHEPGTFFNLAYHLHEATSRDSQPVFPIVHTTTPTAGYDELIALAELAPVFGDWSGLDRLLADSHSAEYVAASGADEFSIDTLDDRVTKRQLANPVSSLAKHCRQRRQLDSAFSLVALHRTLTPPDADDITTQAKLEVLEAAIELSHDTADLSEIETALARKLAQRLTANSLPNMPGWLVLNPGSSTRRVGLELPATAPIPLDSVVKASEFSDGKAKVVVEVPGFGFAWLPRGLPGTVLPVAKFISAVGTTVRNEHLEAELDPATGAIKAIRDGKGRINRLGQILVWHPGSRMVAQSVTVTNAGTALGEVTARGDILDADSKVVARFVQRVRAWAGRPALEIKIDLQPVVPITGYPWASFLGCRFAWRDDRATLFRGVHGQNSLTGSQRPQSPDYLEVRFAKERSFIFTGGLPFLQRQGARMVDVVLTPAGETETSFELLVAFDREFPMATAQTWTHPLPVLEVDKGPPPIGASGWLANIDLPSLILTSLRPVAVETGRAVEARFVETAGFAAAAELRFAKDPVRATMVDLNGEQSQSLTLIDDAIPLDCSANELFTVKAEWQ